MSDVDRDAEYHDLIHEAHVLTRQAVSQSRTLVQELQLLRDLMEELGEDE